MTKTTNTPTFSKQEMEAELREILFIQASQIAHVCSHEAAHHFIGFEYDFSPALTPSEIDIKKINLSHFAIRNYLSTSYDYAFQTGHFWDYGEENNHDIVALAGGVTPVASYGGPSPFHAPDSKVRHVIDMAIGRWNLETGNDLTIRHLALLADMTEAAVRNAMSSEKIKTRGKPAAVEVTIASEWLKTRKGFIQTKIEENRQEFWLAHTRNLLSAPHIGTGMQAILSDLSMTPETAAIKADVPTKFISELIKGVHDYNKIEYLQKIGIALELDVPFFVGKAVEAALRART